MIWNPGPKVYLDDLAADRTTLKMQYWAKTGEWAETRYDMIDAVGQGRRSLLR
jgi:small conductance mechanosensitive channel